jgi:uncharacterized protein (TIGR00255 family)
MTGYACRDVSNANISLSVEIRSYNSRFLEVTVNIPPWLSSLEENIRDCLNKACYRGKVEVTIRIHEHNIPVKVTVNTGVARAYKSAITGLAHEIGIREKPGLSLLLSLDGVLEIEKEHDNNRYWNFLEPVLHETVNAFIESRIKEGKHTELDIMKSFERIVKSLEIISSFAKTMEETIKKTIKTRFTDLLGDKIDENRILAETAAVLVKATISEEISRLYAHLNEFSTEVKNNIHPGKKLDFLSQEINREINTIGSKSNLLEVSQAVIEIKDALENIREQLRNVE